MEYKTGLIRAGDCDVLADHLAHALKKYIPAGVAPGFWNADGDTTISEGEAHARFVYTTSDGRLKAIETTEHPKRSFVNLTFLPGDRVLLEGKINEIEKASQKQKEVRMRAFGQTLEEILKKEAYARFRPKGNFISALSRIQKEQSGDRTGQQGESTGKDRGKGEESGGEGRGDKRDGAGLLDSLEKLDDWRVNLALMALLGALAVATGAGIGISSIILQEKMKRRIQAGNFFKDIELLEAIKTRIPLEKLRKTSEGIEAEFADLCYEFSIPQEVSRTFSGDEKDALVLLHAMRDQQRFFLISYLFASGRVNALRFRKTLTEVAQSQEGVTREDIIETIRTVCESEKFRNIADEAQAKAVDSIWSMVRKYFAEVDARSEEAQLGDILDTGPSVDGGKISRHPGSDEFYQSRPYQKGDDPRHIDQRASGRFDVPLVREFRAGMGGAKQRSFHLVVDLPSVADWEVANLVHLLALAHRKKNVAVNGIDFYAFGMPIQRLSAETMRKLIDNPQLDTEGFKKLVNIIVAGRVRESIHVADSTHNRGMNTYSGLMLSSKMHESLARNHTIVYLGETRGMTTLRSMVHMKQRAPRSSAPPSTAA